MVGGLVLDEKLVTGPPRVCTILKSSQLDQLYAVLNHAS